MSQIFNLIRSIQSEGCEVRFIPSGQTHLPNAVQVANPATSEIIQLNYAQDTCEAELLTKLRYCYVKATK